MNRIPRAVHDPVFTEGRPRRFTKTLVVPMDGEALEARYKHTAWQPVCHEIRGVKQRQTLGLIVANGQHAGSFEIVETRIRTFTSRHDFFIEMDGFSSQTAHLAEVLIEHWEEPTEISDYGDIVELRRVWMAPTLSNKGRLAASMNALLEHQFVQRSLLILKGFPLEYEGRTTDANSSAFVHRQRAMLRHYSRAFGVAPLPGAYGEAGWMYAIPGHLASCIEPPTVRGGW